MPPLLAATAHSLPHLHKYAIDGPAWLPKMTANVATVYALYA
jgi:hypothetical protein